MYLKDKRGSHGSHRNRRLDKKKDGGAQGSGWSLLGRAEAIPGRPAA